MSCRDDLAACQSTVARLRSERDSYKAQVTDLQARLAVCEGTEPPPPPSSSTWNGFTGQNQPPATWRPGSVDSPFNKRIDPTKVHPRSQAKVDWLISFDDNDTPRGLSNVVIWDRQASGKSAAHAICWASNTDPEFAINQTENWFPANEGQKVRIPPQAEPGQDGYDYQLEVVQPDGTSWQFWQMGSRGNGVVNCRACGKSRIDGDLITDYGNATQGSMDLIAGQIRGEEMVAGRINHALFLVVPGAARSGYCVAPAKPSSTLPLTTGTDKVDVGQRFFLDYTPTQIDSMPIKPWEKVIYKALAEYGGYVGDGGGSPSVLLNVVPLSGSTYIPFGVPDPWVNYAKQYAAIYNGGYPLWWTQNVVDWRNRLKVAI